MFMIAGDMKRVAGMQGNIAYRHITVHVTHNTNWVFLFHTDSTNYWLVLIVFVVCTVGSANEKTKSRSDQMENIIRFMSFCNKGDDILKLFCLKSAISFLLIILENIGFYRFWWID